jgi:hypothetical protein
VRSFVRSKKARVSAVLATAALSMGLVAAPAQSQPVVTGGLVNVTVTDVLTGDILSNNNVGVGVAAGVSATICDVSVTAAVLAQQVVRDGAPRTCTSESGDQSVEFTQVNRRP